MVRLWHSVNRSKQLEGLAECKTSQDIFKFVKNYLLIVPHLEEEEQKLIVKKCVETRDDDLIVSVLKVNIDQFY